MSFLLAVALSLKIHIRHCIWMYSIHQSPNISSGMFLNMTNYPSPPKTSIRNQTNLPEVTVRRIVNPGDDDAWWSSAVAVVVTAFLLKFSGITRLSGGRWGCCWLFFLLGGLAAVFRPISVHEVWVDMLLLLLLFCSTDDDEVEVVGLRPAMALLMVDAASIEAWWAGGGQMGSWMDNTALAADIEPIVDRCEVAASLALVSLSSWLLLESSDDDQWAGFEVTDFFAKKQRGISQTQMEWLLLFQITIVCVSVLQKWECSAVIIFPSSHYLLVAKI